MMQLREVAQALGLSWSGNDVTITGVSTDSRAIKPGELFIALVGERFDAHDFLDEIAARGAVAAIVSRHTDAAIPQLVVADTRLALGQLAQWWRSRFELPVIGVVGSNGKTTVKEMCAAILRAEYGDAAVLATTGNLNNDIGLPLMALRLNVNHRVAVLEIGMNHPGETAQLAPIAAPTVALINNAQREHQEFMKSVEAVAEEHALLLDALDSEGIAVFNADDAHAAFWRERAGTRAVLDFGLSNGAVRGHFSPSGFGGKLNLQTSWGELEIDLAVPGNHNARNACGAAAACLAAGVTTAAVVRGLNAFRGVKGRLQRRDGPPGVLVIDDTYNANPDSMRAAIDVLAAIPGRRVFVMGDMGEVGDNAGQMHDEVGGYAKSHGIDRLLCLGEHARAAAANFGAGGEHFGSLEALQKVLHKELQPNTTLLVKGSRFMRLERVTDELAKQGKHDAA